MKTLLGFTLIMLLCTGVAVGQVSQAGSIGIFMDPGGTDCNLWDQVPGLLTFYCVHVLTPCATASQFSAPMPACMTPTVYLSDGGYFGVTIGNSQTGVAIGYGTPQAAPITILSIQYFGQGLTTPCCIYPVLPDPNVPSGQIEVVDCANNLLYATGGTGIVNPNGSCQCDVATEESTWGKVKALYSE